MANILEVSQLRTEFHLRKANVGAVDGISFTVAPGECVGLVGESGCGKSTAGLSIMQLLPNVGHIVGESSIKLNGRELVGLSEKELQKVRGNEVGMIFQDPMTSLNPTMTIGRQIAEGVRIHRGVSRKEAQDRALEVLTLVGMPRPSERLAYYPHQLSGGLRQRVMIAIALACEPQLIIADEPTTALDVTIQAQILNLIDDLRQRLHTAVILITHDMGVIAGRTDRVMVMYAGKIVEGAETGELFHKMRHPYASALLQSIPKLEQDSTQRLYNIPGIPPDLAQKLDNCRFNPRCPNATERCRTEEPPLEQDSANPEHEFACFHPVGSSDGQEVPVLVATPEERAAMLERAERRVNELAARQPLLEITNLVKEFPVTSGAITQRRVGSVKAVSDVSFTVREGETFGLVGESGCGKTTIGRLIVGLEKPNNGSISFGGVDVTKLHGHELRRKRRDMQLMFQDPYSSLDPRMRVGSILREPLIVQGIGSKREQVERVNELISEVGLSRRAFDLYPHEFSGGQRQRIGFARALALNPQLIVADEPVSALDVSIQAQILNMMKSLQERHHLSYVMISHDLAVVKYLADRIGVMYLGKLMEFGPSQAIYERPAHPYTRGLIDTIPVAEPTLARAKLHQPIKGELPSAIDPPSGCRFRTRCPFAQDLCAEQEPPLQLYSSGHYAACHFPLQTPVEEHEVQTALV
ncbi:MAG: ABC transporter ATP-binding protein [Acidimicrobiales bacterium]